MKLDLSSKQATIKPGESLNLDVDADYLYGAPASGNRFTARLGVIAEQHPVEKLPGYFFGDPTTWSDELARYLFVWCSFVGWVVAARKRSHLGIALVAERSPPRVKAAIDGAREIGFAIIAMTLTLTSVFAPLAFATGRTGRLFIEFALTLAGAVLVSGFVALTLTPMMCSILLRPHTISAASTTG